MEYDLQIKIAEFKINGFTLFEDLVAPGKIDELCAAFMPLLEHVRSRETEIGAAEVGDLRTGQGRMQLPSRYTLNWPLDPPFLDPEIYANPVILGFLESYWETDDFQITCLHSNNPWPGSTLQRWHRDTKLLTPGIGNPRHPHFGIKIPLVDTSEENGSIEVLPCTQYLAEADLEGRYDELLSRGDFEAYPRRLDMRRGTFWVQDPARPSPRHPQHIGRAAPGAGDLLLPLLVPHRQAGRDPPRKLRAADRPREGAVQPRRGAVNGPGIAGAVPRFVGTCAH